MKTKVILGFALATLLSFSSYAQDKVSRFAFEAGAGASLAVTKPGNAETGPGLGFDATFSYRFMPHTGIYAGWGWNRLPSSSSFAGNDVCFEETGYVFGLEFRHPAGSADINYYLRAGGLWNHIEIENAEGDVISDSGHGPGLQLAGGLELPLGSKWSLTPGLKFNYLNRDTEYNDVVTEVKQSYISLRAGFMRKF